MGHYTGIATRIKLRRDANPVRKEIFDALYCIGHDVAEDIDIESFNVANMIDCMSSSFKDWDWRHKTPEGLYESRASCTNPNPEAFLSFLIGYRDSLDLNEGDILARFIYEEATQESVIYFDGDELVLSDNGHMYRIDEYSDLKDYDHPGSFSSPPGKRNEPRDRFIPPWNYGEVQEANAQRKNSRLPSSVSFVAKHKYNIRHGHKE